MVGAYDMNGRIPGGVTTIVKSLVDSPDLFLKEGIELQSMNSCLVHRSYKTVEHLSFSNFRNAFKLKKTLMKRMKSDDFDYVFIHSSAGMGLLKDLWIIKHLKRHFKSTKYVIEIHNSDPNYMFTKKKILKRIITKACKKSPDGYIVLSEKIKSYFEKIGIDTNKVETIYNFIEKPQEKTRIIQKIKERKEDTQLHLLYMAGINSLKGFWNMLEALKDVKAPLQLDVCGLPTQKEEADKLNAVGHSDTRVFYHGFVTGNEKDKYFMNADAIILPSNIEGLPVSLIEAINYGCYVIATDVGGVKEVFNQCGTIMKPGDKKEISNAINWLAENKQNIVEKELKNLDYSYDFTIQKYIQNVCHFINSLT